MKKYADLLLHYCLEVKEGQRLYVSSTTLAQPLLLEIHRAAVKANVMVEYDLGFKGKGSAFWEEAHGSILDMEPGFQTYAMEHYDAYLAVRAPFDLYEELHGISLGDELQHQRVGAEHVEGQAPKHSEGVGK